MRGWSTTAVFPLSRNATTTPHRYLFTSSFTFRYRNGPRSSSFSRPRRTSWKLPDVRMPGGRSHLASTLASLDAQLGRRTDPSHRAGPILAHHQLAGGYSVGSSNTAGQLAALKQVTQNPLFTPPHRRPGYSAQQQHLVSRPGGLESRLVDGDGMGSNISTSSRSGSGSARRGKSVALWHFQSPAQRRWEQKYARGDGGSKNRRGGGGRGGEPGGRWSATAFRQWYKDS